MNEMITTVKKRPFCVNGRFSCCDNRYLGLFRSDADALCPLRQLRLVFFPQIGRTGELRDPIGIVGILHGDTGEERRAVVRNPCVERAAAPVIQFRRPLAVTSHCFKAQFIHLSALMPKLSPAG